MAVKKIKVHLSDDEVAQVRAIVIKQQEIYEPHKNLSIEIEKWYRAKFLDIGGKFAVAKHFGVTVSELDDGRVYGPRLPCGPVLVRTMSREWGDLILHMNDKDYRLFVLVYGKEKENDFYLIGWIRGNEGKKQDYWRDPTNTRPAFFIPQTALRPIEELLIPVALQLVR